MVWWRFWILNEEKLTVCLKAVKLINGVDIVGVYGTLNNRGKGVIVCHVKKAKEVPIKLAPISILWLRYR